MVKDIIVREDINSYPSIAVESKESLREPVDLGKPKGGA